MLAVLAIMLICADAVAAHQKTLADIASVPIWTVGDTHPMTDAGRKIIIELPRAPRSIEVVGIQVTTGPLALGTEIEFRLSNGKYIGSAAGFPGTQRSSSLVYQFLISGSDIEGQRFELVATVTETPTTMARSPSAHELVSITATIQGGE